MKFPGPKGKSPQRLPIPAYIAGIAISLFLMVATGVTYCLFQSSLHQLQADLLELHGQWYALLNSAKRLQTSNSPLNVTFPAFHDGLQTFHDRLTQTRVEAQGWEAWDQDFAQQFDRFFLGLDQGEAQLNQLNIWLQELSHETALVPLRLRPEALDFYPFSQPRFKQLFAWSLDKVNDFDIASDTDLRQLSDSLEVLIDENIKTLSDRSQVISLVAALVLGASLCVIVFRLRFMAKILHRQSCQLEKANLQLEEKVNERTEHLTQALRQLQEAQGKLINSEKLAVLGNLAAGIAHELNTPLAAIQSGVCTIETFFHERFETQLTRFIQKTAKDQQVIFTLLHQSLNREVNGLVISQTYRERQVFIEKLREAGAAEPETQALLWAELGLVDEEELWRTHASAKNIQDILEISCDFATSGHMASLIHFSTVKAHYVVSTMRNYLNGSLDEQKVMFALRPEMEVILNLFTPQKRKDLVIEWDIPPTLMVLGSTNLLSQVWLNLVTNALQAMEFQGTLTLEARSDGKTTQVTVGDSGPGIPEEVRHRIFEPFFTTKKQTGGLGLGLDICKKIVEKHGGALAFETRPGRTVFQVTLPDPEPGPPIDAPGNRKLSRLEPAG